MDDYDDDQPLSEEAKAEVRSILQYARVWDMKHEADIIASMYRSLEPTPSLDDWSQLSTDPEVLVGQLMLLWQVERMFRKRLQDKSRQLLELIGKEEP